MHSDPLTRRSFVKTSALATSAVALSALNRSRAIGANDRIRIGVIGVGGMGTAHVGSLVKKSEPENIQVVAVSDVHTRRINRAKNICKGEGYADYRRLLERDDVDAILIATPDHWHAKISMDALEAGKHVYCEKPMTHTVEQALALRDAVRRYKKVFQVGPNATASDGYWKARDAISAGRLGKVTWAQGSYNRNARTCLFNEHQKIDPTAGPDKEGEDMEDNWIDAMRGKGPVHCNVELGCATMVAIKMAVESYRQRKTMLWDAKNEKVMTT